MRLPPLFDDRDFYRKLFKVALPIMAQNIVTTLVNIADTVMIGRLGTVQIAAVAIGANVFFLYNIITFGICSGAAIFTAQYWGNRDIPGIRRNTGLCIILDVAVGLLFTAVLIAAPERVMGIYSKDPAVIAAGSVYLHSLAPSFLPFAVSQVFSMGLRSVEQVRVPMKASFFALVTDVTGNFFLIFGIGPFPALGVAGAAYATDISWFVQLSYILVTAYRRRLPLAGSLRELFDIHSAYVQRFFRICFPVILNETIWSLGISMQNVIYARTGTDVIAAFNINSTISNLCWTVFMGLGNGVAVLIGNKIGAGDEEGARDYASRIIRFAPLMGMSALVILPLFSLFLPFIFNVDRNVLRITSHLLIILAIVYPIKGFNNAMVIGVCRSSGDTVFCAFYDTSILWLVATPAAALASFVFHAPAEVIYICICMEEPIKMILGLWRFFSGKWLHNVIK
jgi:putative MATE family efflux protein